MFVRYEKQYISNLENILYNGSMSLNERTGIRTLRLPSTQIVVDLEKEFPILQSKKVNWKTAVKEILWIMQKQSNITAELGAKIWDQWTGEDGTIGKSYGYQVGQPVCRFNGFNYDVYKDQVTYILETLSNDTSNRQCVINMWNVNELHEMNLVPCVYSSVWNIIDGRLNCMVVQRSADYPVGVPFDTTQYAALVHMFARHLGVKPGVLTHVMADSHIYENQIGGVKKQLEQHRRMCMELRDHKATRHNPSFIIREGVDNFWEMTMDDFDVTDYEPMPAIKFEVAV